MAAELSTDGPTHNPHRPASGKPFPVSTYRVQLRKEFGFEKTQGILDYLNSLGVTHLYCSPYLQASPGSAHGYDVVNHNVINKELGSEEAFNKLMSAVRHVGMGAIADIVPNHVSVADPENLNPYWWDVLKHGRKSAYASWFDVEWDHPQNNGKIMIPVLGSPLEEILSKGELKYEEKGPEGTEGPVLRYWSHVFPIAPGTEHLKSDIPALVAAQHYRPAFWRLTMTGELNYRRFFDVTTLAGIRVEDKDVFDKTHAIHFQQIRDGVLDGLRVDHPDGLANPKEYVERLAEATNGSWVVIEKILEEGEELPAEWPCAGTSGYDTLIRVTGLLVDPQGEGPLNKVYRDFAGKEGDFSTVVDESKRLIVEKSLYAELERLVSLLVIIQKGDPAAKSFQRDAIREALAAYLTAFDVYRAYVQPGEKPNRQALEHLDHAAQKAKASLEGRRDAEIDFIRRATVGEAGPRSPQADEFINRFQQTCGPVMAKGIEDTAFYRYFRLVALNEVGGDPGVFGKSVPAFHQAALEMQRNWPLTMTTLSTHDTKRSEDVRSRLAVLSEIPEEWATVVKRWSERASKIGLRRGETLPDRNTEYLFWQTIVGAWPIEESRLLAYMDKAIREGKVHTSHTDPNKEFDDSVASFVKGVYADTDLTSEIETFCARIAPYGRLNGLSQKLIQLTMPGVPDVYQGCEMEDYSLVDPDNRRAVDYDLRRRALAELDQQHHHAPPQVDATGRAKMFLVSRVLRLRRDRPDWFVGEKATYAPVDVKGPNADRVVAFERSGNVVVVAPRLQVKVKEGNGWEGTVVEVPNGTWVDVFSGRKVEGKAVRVENLVDAFPVALLVRDGGAGL
ncbi:hypothetical protein HK104_005844 [Borealophlyctis nickersoniae]|nr:hypothetical protein HK104_005844 [Borealophlyctis nickersoniae]